VFETATRLLVAGYDARQQIIDISTRSSGYEVIGVARDGQEAVEMAMQLHPEVALISYNLDGISGPQICEILSAVAPAVMLLLVTDKKTDERLEAAMSSGARALLTSPLDPEAFTQMVDKLSDIRDRRKSDKFRQWVDPSSYPQIISVTGAKGGVGKSTIVVNLAVTLLKKLGESVVVLDLSAPFGDVGAMLNLLPTKSLLDMQIFARDLDRELVQTHLTEHVTGVQILPLSTTAASFDSMSPDAMENIIFVLKRMYRYILIDMPPVMSAMHLQLMANSSVVLLVTEDTDLIALADTKKYHDALVAESVSERNIFYVLNKLAKPGTKNQEIEKVFDQKIVAMLPFDGQVPAAGNHGQPIALAEKSRPFVQGISELATWIMEHTRSLATS
jgi:pilus assembly protein CpaE